MTNIYGLPSRRCDNYFQTAIFLRIKLKTIILVPNKLSNFLYSRGVKHTKGTRYRKQLAEFEAIEKVADAGQGVAIYRRALDAASDVDQIQLLAGRLNKAGHKVDLARQLGFLVRWNVIGPFDNTGEKGFDTQYPPEKKIDPTAAYDGKHGKVGWIDHATKHAYGLVDLNKLLVEEKGVLAYAATEFVSEEEQDVEFRFTSFSAVKLWLNGELIDQHNVYHGGSQLDQYVRRATLRPGRNMILVKVCQNEQTQDWAKPWAFQLRVCHKDGTPVLSTDRN